MEKLNNATTPLNNKGELLINVTIYHFSWLQLVILSLSIILLGCYSIIVYYAAHQPFQSDFGIFYNSLQLFIHHQNIYNSLFYPTSMTTLSMHPASAINLNLPLFSVLLLPLAYLNYLHAFIAWTGISLLFSLISLIIFFQHYIKKEAIPLTPLNINSKYAYLFLPAFFIYFPNFVSVQFGQVSLALLLPFMAMWLAARKNKPITAGLLLGVLISIKPFFALFLLFFIFRREWTIIKGCLLTVAFAFAIVSIIFGNSIFVDYQHTLSSLKLFNSSWNASLYGFIGRIWGISGEKNTPIWNLPFLTTVLYSSLSMLLVLMLWRINKIKSNLTVLTQFDLCFSFATVIMLLISPLGWMYYFSFLIIPFTIIYSLAQQCRYSFLIRIILGIALLLSSMPHDFLVNDQVYSLSDIFGSGGYYFYALCLLTLLLLWVQSSAMKTQAYSNKNSHFFLQSLGSITIPSRYYFLYYAILLLPSLQGILVTIAGLSSHS